MLRGARSACAWDELERGCLRVTEKRLDHRTDSVLGRARQRIEPAHDLFELRKPIASDWRSVRAAPLEEQRQPSPTATRRGRLAEFLWNWRMYGASLAFAWWRDRR
jgi:hypothetical protein